jgi:hypothetical protein
MRVENPRLSVALLFFCLNYGVARRDVVPWYGSAAVYIPYVVHTAAVFLSSLVSSKPSIRFEFARLV